MGLAEEVSPDIDVWRARFPWAARELGWEGGWRATMRSPQQVGGLGGQGTAWNKALRVPCEVERCSGRLGWGAVSAQIDELLACPHAVSQGSL